MAFGEDLEVRAFLEVGGVPGEDLAGFVGKGT